MGERSAIVVGGGIGGVATAVGLLRAGWSVRVLEQAPEFGEVGAGISLWSNAFRALDALGLGERVRALGVVRADARLRDRRGRQVVHAGGDPATRTDAVPAIFHRAELLSALLDALPAACLGAGTRVRGVRTEPGRAVVEHDGGESTVDLVVGADGLRSTVRSALWPHAEPPRYAGQTSWRMVLPVPGGVVLPAGESWGPGSVFGMLPMSGDRVYCYATATVPAGQASAGGELAELRDRFAGWHDPIPALLAAARPDAVLRHDLFYLPSLDSYVRDRVALLGDAAHAMTPNLGQGACQALEDAATLSAVLAGDSDVDTALRRYTGLRKRRTQTVARRSRQADTMVHLTSPVAIALRNAALRLVPPSLAMRSFTSTLDWTPP
ncbi:MAG TPA: FAD-dependent monooxygenase [Actinophytocola sp.]|uniref:FAD-dependent monooxygenase n=1 Tax=Actinophytocola sp. TaxID=1872138 RepID=UPI002DDD8F18|nr:FAD-dependent monooxygenase [Actinophytocola sp.]HEV2781947.1 FAD-dependent monooxygenase [Actinophytocola sp.]